MEIRSIIIDHLEKNGFVWDIKNSTEGRLFYDFNLDDSLLIVVELTNSYVNVCSGLLRNGNKYIKSTSMLFNVISLFGNPINHLRDMINQTMVNCLNQMLNFKNEDEKPLEGVQK